MKVDTHSLLLDAALFGTPAATCGGPQSKATPLPPDQPDSASGDEASAGVEIAEPRKPTWPAE